MSILNNIRRSVQMDGTVTISADLISSAMVEKYMGHRLLDEVVDELVKILAQKYAEEHGPEILAAIQLKTVDAKLIQKVVTNLRKELKNESPNA